MVGSNCVNVIVIPARLESTRLPQKLLLAETGKTLLQHTYEAALESQLAHHVIIATDSGEIQDIAERFCGSSEKSRVIMTGEQPTGTHRCCEAAHIARPGLELFGKDETAPLRIINWQADEPCIDAVVADAMFLMSQQVGHPITVAADLDVASQGDQNVVKVAYTEVPGGIGRAVHFSRGAMLGAKHHVGIYCYKIDALVKFCELPENHFSRAENLEQLRVMSDPTLQFELFPIAVAPLSINTRRDYDVFVSIMAREADEEEDSSGVNLISHDGKRGSTH